MNKIILSYCRVSTSEQSTEGAGLDNQKYTNDIAIKQLQLIDSYKRIDDIVEVGSAYKGNNLLTIIENAKAGLYPQGSIIVMFDQTRFSRTGFFDSANKMKELLSTGINIYFSANNEMMTSEKLEDFGGFITMLAKAEAANKESKSRSDRTLSIYARRIADNEIVAFGRLPNWLSKVYDKPGKNSKVIAFEVIPERKKVIESIFEKYIAGQGATTINKWLNDNVEPWTEFDNKRKDITNRVWRESYVSKILVNQAIIGVRIFNVGRENESRVDDYYPAVIDKDKWYQAQEIRKNRPKGTTGGYKYPVNIFSGLSFCGYCGSRCGLQNFNTGRRSAIRCSAFAKKEVSPEICAGGTSPARFLEQVIIEFCSDQINFDAIFKKEMTDISLLKLKYTALEDLIFKVKDKLTKLEDLYFDDEISKSRYIERKNEFTDVLNQNENGLKKFKVEIDANIHIQTTDEEAFDKLLIELKDKTLSNEIRLRLRDLLPKFIEKIDVYRYGHWVSPKQLKQQRELLDTQCDDANETDAIFEVLKSKNVKSRAEVVYGLHFNNGFYRQIIFDAKKETWVSKIDINSNGGITIKGERYEG